MEMDNTVDKLKILKDLKLIKLALEGLCTLVSISELKKKRIRTCSVREKNRDRRRNGFFAQSFLRIKEINPQQFFIYTRMTPQIYNVLLNFVTPSLQKNSLRESVQPECRLAVTLLYLSQGNSLQSLAESFKLGKETVRSIVLETTEVIWSKLSHIYVAEPNEDGYKQIAEDFWNMWDMPNCIGSIDGKHIAIQCPQNGGNQLLNSRKLCSIVLLAACDAQYRFTHVDVGAYGHQNDGGIFQLSRFGKRLLRNKLPIPPSKCLPNTEVKIPYFFVADTAFPLARHLMSPFPGELLPTNREVFNKRLSRARRTIENTFGILVTRWRVLLTTLHLLPNNAEKIVLSCIALHNFVMLNDTEALYVPHNYVDWEDSNGDIQPGLWRSDVENNIISILESPNAHQNLGKCSSDIRNILCNFFKEI